MFTYRLVLSEESIEIELIDVGVYQYVVKQIDQIISTYYLLIDLFKLGIQESKYFICNDLAPYLIVVGAMGKVVNELVDAVGQRVSS